jgi:hypothetical protein
VTASLAVAACGSSNNKPKGDGGGGSTGGLVLTPTADGFFDDHTNSGVIGAWYAYGDWYSDSAVAGMGPCAMGGGQTVAANCSTFTTPVPGQPFATGGPSGNALCASGQAAVVLNMDYSDFYGAGIGFDFNNAGLDGGTGKMAYDPTAHGFTGISFDIDVPPGNNLRVEFPTTAMTGITDKYSAWWNTAQGTANTSPVKTGTNSFTWSDIKPPAYSAMTSAGIAMWPAFDPTKILSIQFHVVTNTSTPVSFGFCISNLTLLHP